MGQFFHKKWHAGSAIYYQLYMMSFRVLICLFHLQAGTQFWDEKMDKELAKGQLSGMTFDRWV